MKMTIWAEKAEAIAKDYFPVGMSCASLKRDIRLLAEEARAKGIEELEEACSKEPCGPRVGASIDYASGYRMGAQAQRMVISATARKLKEQP